MLILTFPMIKNDIKLRSGNYRKSQSNVLSQVGTIFNSGVQSINAKKLCLASDKRNIEKKLRRKKSTDFKMHFAMTLELCMLIYSDSHNVIVTI